MKLSNRAIFSVCGEEEREIFRKEYERGCRLPCITNSPQYTTTYNLLLVTHTITHYYITWIELGGIENEREGGGGERRKEKGERREKKERVCLFK